MWGCGGGRRVRGSNYYNKGSTAIKLHWSKCNCISSEVSSLSGLSVFGFPYQSEFIGLPVTECWRWFRMGRKERGGGRGW